MNNAIDLGVAIIQRWNNETINNERITNDENDDESSFNWHPVLYSLLVILFVVLIILISHRCYK